MNRLELFQCLERWADQSYMPALSIHLTPRYSLNEDWNELQVKMYSVNYVVLIIIHTKGNIVDNIAGKKYQIHFSGTENLNISFFQNVFDILDSAAKQLFKLIGAVLDSDVFESGGKTL